MVFHQILWWCPQIHNEFKEYEEKSNFIILKVMWSTSKTKLNHCLNVLYIQVHVNVDSLFKDLWGDDPKLMGDSGEVLISKRSGWRFASHCEICFLLNGKKTN